MSYLHFEYPDGVGDRAGDIARKTRAEIAARVASKSEEEQRAEDEQFGKDLAAGKFNALKMSNDKATAFNAEVTEWRKRYTPPAPPEREVDALKMNDKEFEKFSAEQREKNERERFTQKAIKPITKDCMEMTPQELERAVEQFRSNCQDYTGGEPFFPTL